MHSVVSLIYENSTTEPEIPVTEEAASEVVHVIIPSIPTLTE